jgi:23S rRNA (pseudouridine1915-N3)-methyltransferase
LAIIHIIAVGKDKDVWVSEGIAHFEKLLKRYARIKWTIIDAEIAKSSSAGEVKLREAEKMQRHLKSGTIIALADSGIKCDSLRFAKKMEGLLARSSGELKFLIGGPHGLDQSVLDSASEIISLSPLTFSHQLVRLVMLEQLYRAFSILQGTGYHK